MSKGQPKNADSRFNRNVSCQPGAASLRTIDGIRHHCSHLRASKSHESVIQTMSSMLIIRGSRTSQHVKSSALGLSYPRDSASLRSRGICCQARSLAATSLGIHVQRARPHGNFWGEACVGVAEW